MHLPYKWNRFAYNARKIKGGIKRRKRHNGSGTPEARPWSFASLNTLLIIPEKIKGGIKRRKRSFASLNTLVPFKIELFFCIFTECIKINKR
jgi:hypothetical protein